MENLFSEFKPITPELNPSKEDITKYYLENNLTFGTDLLDNYFFSDTPSETIPVIKDNPLIDNPTIKLPKTQPMQVTNKPHDKKYYPQNKIPLAKQAIEFFVNKGLSKEQAAGIVGNLYAESRFNPTVLGDQGTSFGIAQWRLSRRKNLEYFAAENQLPLSEFETQLEFVWHELNTSHKKALNLLLESNDPITSARIFSDHFEKPKVFNQERSKYAQTFYYL